MPVHIIYRATDNVLELDGLASENPETRADSFQNAATVEVTLLDANETEVECGSWPLALSYVDNTDGRYQATLTNCLNIIKGQPLTALVTADVEAGLFRTWRRKVEAQDGA